MNTKFYFALLLVCCLFLPGCGIRDTRSFPRIKRPSASQTVKGNIEIFAHILSTAECADYFDVDIIALGYCPLCITFENKSSDTYVVRPSYVGLPRISGKEIVRYMHYDTYQRVLWLTLPALWLWWPAIPCIVVPYALQCAHYNKKTTHNIRKKTFGRNDVLTIAPYEKVQRFVFVPLESFKDPFTIKLYNETTRDRESYEVFCF